MRILFISACLLLSFFTLAAADGDRDLVFSVHPFVSARELHNNLSPLIEYIEKQIDRKIKITVASSYEDNIMKLGEDLADIVYIGPVSYVVMTEKYSRKRIIASLSVDGRPYFKGYVFTKDDNAAVKLADLAGKSFASSSKNSTMSYIVPRYMFIEAGVPFPEEKLQLRENHNNVALTVLAGKVNAGAVKEKTYEKYRDRGLKTIAVTPEIPEHLFVAGDKMDDATYKKIKQAMLAIKSPEDIERLLKPIKSTLTGLSDISDSDYDVLRRIINTVKDDELRTK
ncbi:phosphate/phosphite/phosphonate ABC transporter substrate-binding protein [bacterium]|nr:phosphate/phosphite/phosphonate ABC transporter substrate-binding protein [bacterium]